MTDRHTCRARDGWHYCECTTGESHGPDKCQSDAEGLPRFSEPKATP